jgi:hypothetical protein
MAIKPTHLGKTAAQDENALVYALRRMNLEGAGDILRKKMVDIVVDTAFNECKRTAPHKTGALRESIYKEVVLGKYLIRGKVAIPVSIPYRFSVIFGDKRHIADRFMERALEKGMDAMYKSFGRFANQAAAEAKER